MNKDIQQLKCPVCGKGYIYSRKHPTAGMVYVHKVKQLLYNEVILEKYCTKK